MRGCTACPRSCGADRINYLGVCQSTQTPRIARAALHYWEEPCISGERGSGTVFFSGCSLKCIYCQNKEISTGNYGKNITTIRLRAIYGELIEQGAHNINLVNPTHWIEAILESLNTPLTVPVVYNTGGYEKPESILRLRGKVGIFLPDFKYADAILAEKLSGAKDYPGIALAAIKKMYEEVGNYVLDDDGMMVKGVIVRHLIIPGHLENTRRVIEQISHTFQPGQILFSLMSQYTPPHEPLPFPELNRRLTQEEYDEAMDYIYNSDIDEGFFQELSSAKEEYTPPFDLSGV